MGGDVYLLGASLSCRERRQCLLGPMRRDTCRAIAGMEIQLELFTPIWEESILSYASFLMTRCV